jgi:hypothetical protein
MSDVAADDLDILDLAGTDVVGDEASHFAAEEACYWGIEAAMRDAFCKRLGGGAIVNALTPEALERLRQAQAGIEFCDFAEAAENRWFAGAQAALEAGSAAARRVRAAKAGKARGAMQKAANAERDQWLREQWKTIDTKGNAGLLVLQTRMRRNVYRRLQLRRLRDIVEPKPQK